MEVDNEEMKVESMDDDTKVRDPNLISDALYLLTPDFYFTLPKLPSSLEEFTKTYYKKN